MTVSDILVIASLAQRGAAIQGTAMDCFASLAMTSEGAPAVLLGECDR